MKASRATTSSSDSPPPASLSASRRRELLEAPSPAGDRGDLRARPMHDEISACARDLWRKYGCPSGRDEAIWLEAERQLLGVDRDIARADQPVSARGLNDATGAASPLSTPGGEADRSGTVEESELAGASSSSAATTPRGATRRRGA